MIGLVMYSRLDSWQKRWEQRQSTIMNGKVTSQTLVVAKKYQSVNFRKNVYSLLFTNLTGDEASRTVSRRAYDDAHIGDTVLGYQYADGFLIPSTDKGHYSEGKLMFLGVALLPTALQVVLFWRTAGPCPIGLIGVDRSANAT